jgi:selenium-binding protein 1
VNMVSPSFDGTRVYYTTSLLGNWDMKGKADEQFLKMYHWDGKELKPGFEIDFYKEKLGRAHHMKFQVRDLKTLQPLQATVESKTKFASN